MNERKTEIFVGLFVTLAMVGLIAGVIWGKNLSLFSKRQRLAVRFDNVRGLEVGDPVVIRGLEMGGVEGVQLGPGYVDVSLWVEKDVPLYSDLQAVIEPKEIMGGKQITLFPGTGREPAAPGTVYYGLERGDFGVLLAQSERVLFRLDSLLSKTSEALKPQKIDEILKNMEVATNQTRMLISETRQPLNDGIRHLAAISKQLDADSTVARVSVLIAKLDTTAFLFQQIGRRIEAQEGTLGKLVQDKALYSQMVNTTGRLDSLITDIKANPKRYLHVSVF